MNNRLIKNNKQQSVQYKTDTDELLLSPCEVSDESSNKVVYALEKAINTKDAYNIALSGSYGSGKSSILKSLINSKKGSLKFLEISLASLNQGKCPLESDAKEERQISSYPESKPDRRYLIEIEKIRKERSENLANELEYAILQQILHKAEASKVPQSGFKRINYISKCKARTLSAVTLLFILCSIIVFEPQWLKIQSFVDFFTLGKLGKLVTDIICVFVILSILFSIVRHLIVKYGNFKVKRLNVRNGDIDFEATESIFNKYLDEILYFFQVNPYNVVVFEDLDRFNDTTIFLKLRELNHILNKSESIKYDITFIYAIKDDLFPNSDDRTKFFDKIIVSVPFVNTSNSASKLFKFIGKDLPTTVEESICYRLGAFINDMRLLKNIVAEYKMYLDVIGGQIDIGDKDASIDYASLIKKRNSKFLAIIAYKNYCPEDFANLHKGEGVLFNILEGTETYRKDYVNKKNKEIGELNEKIYEYESIATKNIQELRSLYLRFYNLPDNYLYFDNKNTYTFEQIIESDELFTLVTTDSLLHMRSNNSYGQGFNLRFKDIEQQVDPNKSYNERLQICEVFYKEQLYNEIKNKELEILQINSLTLSELYKKSH